MATKNYLMDALNKTSDSTPYQAPMPGDHDCYEEEDYNECPFVQVPDIRQNDDYSCGACAAMSVGKYYNVGPNTIDEWKKALGTDKAKSTDPKQICSFLESLGLQCVEKHGMKIKDLCYYTKLRIPVICCIQEWGDPKIKNPASYGHYVIVVWVGHGYVFVQDPSIDNVMQGEGGDNAEGKMMITCDEWMADWFDDGLDDEKYERFGIAVFPSGKK
jgi:hypothetical protein